MQGVSGFADDFVRGSASFGGSNLTTKEKKGVVKLLQEFCGMCEAQGPQQTVIEAKNNIPCKEHMCQCGEVE
eukprot:12182562-Karenia_brevis.AAC.1